VVLFHFFSWALAVVGLVTLLWPLNVPLLALAYKVRQGGKKIDMEPREFWGRSLFGALGLAVLFLLLLGLAYVLVEGAELPAPQVLFFLLLLYLPVAAFYLFWMYALEDFLQGFSVFALYVLLPTLPILLAGRFTGLWRVVRGLIPWIIPS
jgi:hypothetical protein